MKIFRKKRKEQLKENKTVDYLKYAIGEITLVVIGILIALQLNNLNAENKIEKQIHASLMAFKKDLNLNIIASNSFLEWSLERDSLIDIVINKKATRKMYEEGSLFILHTIYNQAAIRDDNLNKLLQFEDNMGEEYDDLLYEIKTYKGKIESEHEVAKMFSDYTIEQGIYIANNYEWFSALNTGTPKEAIDYMLTDPFYMNRLMLYKTYLNGNLSSMILHRRNREFLLLEMIEQFSEEEEKVMSLKDIMDKHQMQSCALIDCNDSIYTDTSYKAFTAPLLKNLSNDSVFLNLLDAEGKLITQFSLAPEEFTGSRLPNECIFEQTNNAECIQRFKVNKNSYLIFE